jgi:hypothetical protein
MRRGVGHRSPPAHSTPFVDTRPAGVLTRSWPTHIASKELLATVDVVGRTRQRGIDHEVYGKRGDVLGLYHAPDRQGGSQLFAACGDVVAEQPCRQRRVDEAGREGIDPDRRDFERKVPGQRGKPGLTSCRRINSRSRPSNTGTALVRLESCRANVERAVRERRWPRWSTSSP